MESPTRKLMNIYLQVMALVAMLFFANTLCAAEVVDRVEIEKYLEKFKLWNYCEPVALFVEDLSDNAEKIGLTEERIKTAVESRLRGARIYEEPEVLFPVYLYVNVDVLGRAFVIKLSLNFNIFREVYSKDAERESYFGRAETWSNISFGGHGGHAAFILQALAEATDGFVNEYLRVNAEACS